MRPPGSGNFETLLLVQLLDYLLNVIRSYGLATGSHPCKRKLKRKGYDIIPT